MKSQERTGDLPAADSPIRTTDSIWKPFPAHTWGAFATDEQSRTWQELLRPVLPVFFILSVQEQLPGTYCLSHTASRKHSASLQHSSLLKNKLMTPLLKRLFPKVFVQEKHEKGFQEPSAEFFLLVINIHKHSFKSKLSSLILYLN